MLPPRRHVHWRRLADIRAGAHCPEGSDCWRPSAEHGAAAALPTWAHKFLEAACWSNLGGVPLLCAEAADAGAPQRTWSCRRASGTSSSSSRTWTRRTWHRTSMPRMTSSRRHASPATVKPPATPLKTSTINSASDKENSKRIALLHSGRMKTAHAAAGCGFIEKAHAAGYGEAFCDNVCSNFSWYQTCAVVQIQLLLHRGGARCWSHSSDADALRP